MTAITLTLPWPPSVNHYWRNIIVAGRSRIVISKAGRQYRETVAQLVSASNMAARLDTRLTVTISASPPDRRRRDIDNVLKSLLDALTYAGTWQDDEQIDDLRIVRAGVDSPGRVDVVVSTLEGEA